jgi:hypothetical protein
MQASMQCTRPTPARPLGLIFLFEKLITCHNFVFEGQLRENTQETIQDKGEATSKKNERIVLPLE